MRAGRGFEAGAPPFFCEKNSWRAVSVVEVSLDKKKAFA
jgi:hypothetical protein